VTEALLDGRSTIFAPATGAARSAVAVLRVSGPAAAAVAQRLTGRVPAPRRASLATLLEPQSRAVIDQALLLYFPAPESFTGEDVLEIQHHGGLAVARLVADALNGMPELRPAEPGEFTRRAFLNGKLDLTQAEGLADLIEASTAAQARAALRQMAGVQGQLYAAWREEVLGALALLEAEIDFAAEEEVPEALWQDVEPRLAATAAAIGRHLADGAKGERLRAGLVVAVTGAPNVGKSSLVNALAGRDVAIVTAVPGTTRDVIEVALDLEGLPVMLLDTAGIRETDDPIEREGVARAVARAETADIRLLLVDAPSAIEPPRAGSDRTITVLSKADLWPSVRLPDGCLAVSATTGAGLDTLLATLLWTARDLLPGEDAVLVTRSRHRAALMDAEAALTRALMLGGSADLGLLAEELRLAARAIGRVTGAFGVEDILDRVFATFCIGK
jgi:tRNA modification GTPase